MANIPGGNRNLWGLSMGNSLFYTRFTLKTDRLARVLLKRYIFLLTRVGQRLKRSIFGGGVKIRVRGNEIILIWSKPRDLDDRVRSVVWYGTDPDFRDARRVGK